MSKHAHDLLWASRLCDPLIGSNSLRRYYRALFVAQFAPQLRGLIV